MLFQQIRVIHKTDQLLSNDDNGILIGGSSTNKVTLAVSGGNVVLQTLVNEQDFEIKVKPISGTVTALKVDTGPGKNWNIQYQSVELLMSR